jgi:hypothetical protein
MATQQTGCRQLITKKTNPTKDQQNNNQATTQQ